MATDYPVCVPIVLTSPVVPDYHFPNREIFKILGSSHRTDFSGRSRRLGSGTSLRGSILVPIVLTSPVVPDKKH